MRRADALGIGAAFLVACASPARAENRRAPAETKTLALHTEPVPSLTFRYTTLAEPEYFRAVLEGIGVLSLGYVEYLASTQKGRGTIQPGFDWTIFRDKLSGNAQSLDINQFNTNFVGHPLGGTLYYLAARSNRLSVVESFLWAFLGSATWEYLGEITEKPSYNDMVVTPWAGISNGETFTQLSSFFARGRPTFANRALSAFFSLPRAVHDAVDGLEPEPAPEFDALGFPADVWHRFSLSAGGWVSQLEGSDGPQTKRGNVGLQLSTEIINLPDYQRPGRHARTFGDGNWSRFDFGAAFSGSALTQARFATRASPFGYTVSDVRRGRDGRLHGDTGIFALTVGFEYGVHRYGPPHEALDKIALVDALGGTFDYRGERGKFSLHARLDGALGLAGVRSLALAEYLRQNQPENLPTVLRNEHYYFAASLTVNPRLELRYEDLELGGELKLNQFYGILGLDDDESHLTRDIPRSDQRHTVQSWISYTLPGERWRLTLTGARTVRSGAVQNARAEHREVSGGLWLGVLL